MQTEPISKITNEKKDKASVLYKVWFSSFFIVFNEVNNTGLEFLTGTGHMVEPFSEKGLRGRYYLIRPNVCMYNAIYRNCNCGLPNSSIVRHD